MFYHAHRPVSIWSHCAAQLRRPYAFSSHIEEWAVRPRTTSRCFYWHYDMCDAVDVLSAYNFQPADAMPVAWWGPGFTRPKIHRPVDISLLVDAWLISPAALICRFLRRFDHHPTSDRFSLRSKSAAPSSFSSHVEAWLISPPTTVSRFCQHFGKRDADLGIPRHPKSP